MGRTASGTLGVLGIILPGYLLYLKYKLFGTSITSLVFHGFIYRFTYRIRPSVTTTLWWIDGEWLKPEWWGGNTELYCYLASFGLAVLGLLVFLGNPKGGSYLFLLAGLVNIGLLLLVYSNIEKFFQFPNAAGYPIPVGSIFLLLAGLLGRRD